MDKNFVNGSNRNVISFLMPKQKLKYKKLIINDYNIILPALALLNNKLF